jgi:hypothetical protein
MSNNSPQEEFDEKVSSGSITAAELAVTPTQLRHFDEVETAIEDGEVIEEC